MERQHLLSHKLPGGARAPEWLPAYGKGYFSAIPNHPLTTLRADRPPPRSQPRDEPAPAPTEPAGVRFQGWDLGVGKSRRGHPRRCLRPSQEAESEFPKTAAKSLPRTHTRVAAGCRRGQRAPHTHARHRNPLTACRGWEAARAALTRGGAGFPGSLRSGAAAGRAVEFAPLTPLPLPLPRAGKVTERRRPRAGRSLAGGEGAAGKGAGGGVVQSHCPPPSPFPSPPQALAGAGWPPELAGPPGRAGFQARRPQSARGGGGRQGVQGL